MTRRTHDENAGTPAAAPARIEAYAARAIGPWQLGEAPLIALAGGLAAGALIAALLPRTGAETRAIRPTARRVKDSAKRRSRGRERHRQRRLERTRISREKGEETLRTLFRGRHRRGGGSAGAALERAREKADLSVQIAASEPAMSKLHLVFGGRVKDPRSSTSISTPSTSSASTTAMPRPRSVARQCAAHRRRCRDEICGRPPAPAAGAGRRRDRRALSPTGLRLSLPVPPQQQRALQQQPRREPADCAASPADRPPRRRASPSSAAAQSTQPSAKWR